MNAHRQLWVIIALSLAMVGSSGAADGWIEIDYGPILDRRQLSHSGEPVGVLLDRLAGRPVPEADERPADRVTHGLLGPLVEPYGFVISDALDSLRKASDEAVFVEVGSLWLAGGIEPAWVELLRSRHMIVESDGEGSLRLILPWTGTNLAEGSSEPAAQEAFDAAWPVLRHLFAAERRRLEQSGQTDPTLAIVAHAYTHEPARSSFRVGSKGVQKAIRMTGPAGRRPPLDLRAIERFLASGMQLEGARLESDGQLRWFGSQTDHVPTLAGKPIGVADIAVAYRAVFHGGQAEPYMSLDRAYAPQAAIVNYGGRLADTAIGAVSLACDIRFKTFSGGLDITDGTDARSRVRARIPGFKTHLERLAASPASAAFTGQQTRLWFYPDDVDLTVAPAGDLVALRKVRMSAASERVGTEGNPGGDPSWTRETVAAIDRDYDSLAAEFPELAELDHAVRLLSLFTWLLQADADGLTVPDLDALLAVELPAVPTPRTFPQLLSFNALPAPGADALVDVFDRVSVGEALERLDPGSGRLIPARQRFERARGWLDRRDPPQEALLSELAALEPAALAETELDLYAYRAARLRMHQLVLRTLGPEPVERLSARERAGESLRVFSVGIGGLDLGMGAAVARASGRRLGLNGAEGPRVPITPAGPPGEAGSDLWRIEPEGMPNTSRTPNHGIRATEVSAARSHRADRGMAESGRWQQVIDGFFGPSVRSRRTSYSGSGEWIRVERVEGSRRFNYSFVRAGDRWSAVPDKSERRNALPSVSPSAPPAGLGLLSLGEPTQAGVSASVPVRLDATVAGVSRSLAAELPRAVLQRAVFGRAVDLAPGQPLPALAPLPPALADPKTLMVLMRQTETLAPWVETAVPVAGETRAELLARMLPEWWTGIESAPIAAVVGVDSLRSLSRWERAPRLEGPVALLLPVDAFPGVRIHLRDEIAQQWIAGPVISGLDPTPAGSLVVLVSAEGPEAFSARVAALAEHSALTGKLVAAWAVGTATRDDLPVRVLEIGRIAGLGLGLPGVVGARDAPSALARYAKTLKAAPPNQRVEEIEGPFVWFF